MEKRRSGQTRSWKRRLEGIGAATAAALPRRSLPRLRELHAGRPAPPNNCLVSAKCYIKTAPRDAPPRRSLAGGGAIVTKPDSFVTVLRLLLLGFAFLGFFLQLFVFTFCLISPLAMWFLFGKVKKKEKKKKKAPMSTLGLLRLQTLFHPTSKPVSKQVPY